MSKQEFHLWERSLERSFTLENLCRWLCRCFTVWLFALAAAHVVLKNSQGTSRLRHFSRPNSLLAHGIFSSWRSTGRTVTDLLTLGAGGRTRLCVELAENQISAQTPNQKLSHILRLIHLFQCVIARVS